MLVRVERVRHGSELQVVHLVLSNVDPVQSVGFVLVHGTSTPGLAAGERRRREDVRFAQVAAQIQEGFRGRLDHSRSSGSSRG